MATFDDIEVEEKKGGEWRAGDLERKEKKKAYEKSSIDLMYSQSPSQPRGSPDLQEAVARRGTAGCLRWRAFVISDET